MRRGWLLVGGLVACNGADQVSADDGNDSFEEAAELPLGPAGVAGTIDLPGDVDFYRFEARADQWLQFVAIGTNDPTNEVLPVITLYHATHTPIAEAPIVLMTHLALAGTYYVEIQDFSTWRGQPSAGGPAFRYTLAVAELQDGQGGVWIDDEAGDDPASAKPIELGPAIMVAGLFRDVSDRDAFAITIEASAQTFLAFPSPGGFEGNGSTGTVGRLWVTDESGTSILARVDTAATGPPSLLGPPLEGPGTFLLWVESSGTPPEANDFYTVFALGGADNPVELEPRGTIGANDTIAAAATSGEVLTLIGSPLSAYLRVWIEDGDMDYIGFDVTEAVTVELTCGARSNGSGVEGLTFEIRDDADVILGAGGDGEIANAALPTAGRHWIRLAKTGQDAEIAGNFARCRVRIPTF